MESQSGNNSQTAGKAKKIISQEKNKTQDKKQNYCEADSKIENQNKKSERNYGAENRRYKKQSRTKGGKNGAEN